MFVRRLITAAILLLAALSVAAKTNVTSIAELKELFRAKPKYLGFVVTGTVMHVSDRNAFILRDNTSAVELFGAITEVPSAGSQVIVNGQFVSAPTGEPWTGRLRLEKTGFQPLPPPQSVALADLDDPRLEFQNVTVTATVIDVRTDDVDDSTDFMLVKDGETVVPVVSRHDPSLRNLVDAQVRVTGVNKHQILSARKYMSPCIFIGNRSAIVQTAPPPDDPFAFPELESDLYVSPRQIAQRGKRAVTGTILASWQPNNVLLRTDHNRIVRLALCSGEPLPACGRHCKAVGHPVSDTYHVNLVYARVRTDEDCTSVDEQPETTTAERIYLDNNTGVSGIQVNYHGRLITLEGIVQGLPDSDIGKRQLLLDCGKLKVPVDFSACPDAARDIPLGSTIAATGRCVLEVPPWQSTDVLPRINDLLLVARHAGDLRVLVPPPWLTVGKLLVIVAALLLVLLVVFIRNRILRRISVIRLNDRTQLAVELHDSLSQSLAGIAYQITAAQRDDDRQSADRKLATADQMLQSCRTELKNCLFDLRNDTMSEKTFDRAIHRTIEKFDDQADIAVRFNVSRAPFDDSTVHAILAIVRELVSNAITHGHAWAVRVAGTLDDGKLMFSVRDDGEGFDPKSAPGAEEGHFGLDGIRDRVKRLNGTFEIKPNAPRGIKAIVTLPAK